MWDACPTNTIDFMDLVEYDLEFHRSYIFRLRHHPFSSFHFISPSFASFILFLIFNFIRWFESDTISTTPLAIIAHNQRVRRYLNDHHDLYTSCHPGFDPHKALPFFEIILSHHIPSTVVTRRRGFNGWALQARSLCESYRGTTTQHVFDCPCRRGKFHHIYHQYQQGKSERNASPGISSHSKMPTSSLSFTHSYLGVSLLLL